MLSSIPEWAITFWPLWPTLFLISLFAITSALAPVFAGPWATSRDSMEIAIKAAGWISAAIWALWGIIWMARFAFRAICWVCGCDA